MQEPKAILSEILSKTTTQVLLSKTDINVLHTATGTGVENAITGEKHMFRPHFPCVVQNDADGFAYVASPTWPPKYCDELFETEAFKDETGRVYFINGEKRVVWHDEEKRLREPMTIAVKRPGAKELSLQADWFRIPENGAHHFWCVNRVKAPCAFQRALFYQTFGRVYCVEGRVFVFGEWVGVCFSCAARARPAVY